MISKAQLGICDIGEIDTGADNNRVVVSVARARRLHIKIDAVASIIIAGRSRIIGVGSSLPRNPVCIVVIVVYQIFPTCAQFPFIRSPGGKIARDLGQCKTLEIL